MNESSTVSVIMPGMEDVESYLFDTGSLINYKVLMVENSSFLSVKISTVTEILSAIASFFFTTCGAYVDAGLEEGRTSSLRIISFHYGALVFLIGILLMSIFCIIKELWVKFETWRGTDNRSRPGAFKILPKFMAKAWSKAGNQCKQRMYGGLLIFLSVLLTFLLICCFVTNEDIKPTEKRPHHQLVHNATENKLDFTKLKLETVFLHNFNVWAKKVQDVFERSQNELEIKPTRNLGPEALKDLYDTFDTINKSCNLLTAVKKSFEDLNNHTSTLSSNFKIIQTILEHCNTTHCVEFQKSPIFKDLMMASNFSLNLFRINEICDEVQKNQFIKKIKLNIPAYIKSSVFETLENFNQTLKEIVENATAILELAVNQTIEVQEEWFGMPNKILNSDNSRYTIGRAICVILSLIFLLLIVSTFIAIAGVEPNSIISNNLIFRNTASWLLNGCKWVIILLAFIFSILTMYSFLKDGFGGGDVCESLNSLDKPRRDLSVDKESDLNNNVQLQPSYNDILRSCKMNSSVFHALNLNTVFDFTHLKSIISGLKEKTSCLNDNTNQTCIKEMTSSKNETMVLVRQFSESLHDVTLQPLALKLSKAIKSVDLVQVTQGLEAILKDKESGIQLTGHLDDLEREKGKLREYSTNDWVKKANASLSHLKELEDFEKFLAQMTVKLLDYLQQPDPQFSVSKSKELVGNITWGLIRQVDQYENFTNTIANEMGRCLPVYESFQSAVSSVCNNSVLPIRGFWLAVLFLLILLFYLAYVASLFAQFCDELKGPSGIRNIAAADNNCNIPLMGTTGGENEAPNSAVTETTAL